ncbi:MAG: hypothetical protein GX285_02725 [Clostridiales bacterium]|nr:hypothetical protein [Clostridiales bacterium]
MDYKKTVKKYIYERDGRKCRFCDKDLLFRQISLDHYVPKSKNGPDDIFNIVLSCKKCNKYKMDKILPDYDETIIENFKQAVIDKKILESSEHLKYQELSEMIKSVDRVESIGEITIFQGKNHRFYVKDNNIFKIIHLG